MSGRVSISRKTAQYVLNILADHQGYGAVRAITDAASEIERGLKPKKYVKAAHRVKRQKDKTKKEMRTEVRAQIMKRADGRCEACGIRYRELHWDHFFGRVKVAEEAATGWALCAPCDNAKTLNHPSAAAWLQRFASHAKIHGYGFAAEKAINRLEALAISRGEREASP